MTKRPKIFLLDMFCGAGGAAVGYYKAAKSLNIKIDILGVDIKDQPNYPFRFLKTCALEYLSNNPGKHTHIHSSPPCQQHSNSTAPHKAKGKNYPDLIPATRNLIKRSGKPGVIENVITAPIIQDIVLRGDMFGLKVLRKRAFELVNWWTLKPLLPVKVGSAKNGDYVIVYGKASYKRSGRSPVKIPVFAKRTIRETWAYAMDIDWMTKDIEIAESIPPAYTEYIGKLLFEYKPK